MKAKRVTAAASDLPVILRLPSPNKESRRPSLPVWLFAGGDAADFCRCPAVAEVAEPVCGTDGQTYQSRAYLYCAARCQKKDIKVAHPGNC
ncbi:turripeptide Gli9.1-like isoform X3 [Phymastichus coffea]|uniref:turripeptide Gli9.1-like isoform X3 n=1 Tax=Phymastichus coffea TaxID=108790 RepID=UPI00273B552B|nr:turripeptide Gli9.1-like isoform X3 [Phymastichus coffea]